jgi:hypothetical protein
MAGPANKGYKRSWKNLLLNKRYQLQFTLFMVGLSALLMAGLGLWVMKEANEATEVAMGRVIGEPCAKVPVLSDVTPVESAPSTPMKLDDGATVDIDDGSAGSANAGSANAGSANAGSANAGSADAGSAAAEPAPTPSEIDPAEAATPNKMQDVVAVAAAWCRDASCKPGRAEPLAIKVAHCDDYVKKKLADAAAVQALRDAHIPVVSCGSQTYTVADATVEPPPEHHVHVQIDESSMTLTPEVPSDFADRIVAHWTCELRQAGAIDALHRGRQRILWVLLGTGLALILGLAFYGIKMTHKVAGPLFKVSLYLAKMKDGRFDKVYNLRKGDQLVDFYEHFKTAHAGVVTLEKDDVTQLEATIAAAEGAGLGDHEAVKALRDVLARKEKSLE